jgi:hypothetical protein
LDGAEVLGAQELGAKSPQLKLRVSQVLALLEQLLLGWVKRLSQLVLQALRQLVV